MKVGGARVTWLELFYDLVVAASMLVVYSTLAKDQSPWNRGWQHLVVLVVFLFWLMTSLALNRLESANNYVRTLVFVQMGALLVAVLAASVSGSVSGNIGVGALSIVLLTISGLTFEVGRKSTIASKVQKRGGIAGLLIALALGINAFTPEAFNAPAMTAVFVLLAVAYLFFFLPRVDRRFPIDRDHLAERMGQLLLIVMGETFFEVVLAYKEGMEAHIFGIALVITMLGLTWALYFDSIWPAGRPRGSYALVVWICGHALAAVGIGQASIGLSRIAVREEGNALVFLTDATLVYALMGTFLGFAIIVWAIYPRTWRLIATLTAAAMIFWAFGLSTEALAGIDIQVQGAVVAALLLITVILSSRFSRKAGSLPAHDLNDARTHVE